MKTHTLAVKESLSTKRKSQEGLIYLGPNAQASISMQPLFKLFHGVLGM